MDSTLLDIIKIGSGFLGGGLAGAILNNIIANKKSRIQPIGKRVKISNVFTPNDLVYPHLTKITFSDTTSESYHFDNLTIAQVEIINSGNKDFDTFEFGLTLKKDTSIINIDVKGTDRHHIITNDPAIDFNNPSKIIDFKLTPFNRKDKYDITLFLTCNNNMIGELKFSSKLPVKFVDPDSIKKTIIEILKESKT